MKSKYLISGTILVASLLIVGGIIAGVLLSKKKTNSTTLTSVTQQTSTRANIKPPPQGECGVPSFNPSIDINSLNPLARVINGMNAESHSWPWLISIRLIQSNNNGNITFGTHHCAGSLIYEDFVITTAHCFNNKEITADKLLVIVGKNNLNDTVTQSDMFLVDQLIIYPEYSIETTLHDIAILKLKKRVVLSSTVKLVCLPESNNQFTLPMNKRVVGIGWGRSTVGPNVPSFYSNRLQQIILTVINGESICDSQSKYVPELMYCVLDKTNNKGNVCWGDSGGPLLLPLNNKWYMFGNTNLLNAFEDGSCDPSKPAYYTMLPYYLKWIASLVTPK